MCKMVRCAEGLQESSVWKAALADHQQAALSQGAHRAGPRTLLEQGHLADELTRPAHRKHDILPVLPFGNLEFAIQDGVERIARTALFEYQLPGFVEIVRGHLVQLLQVLVGEIGKRGTRRSSSSVMAPYSGTLLRYWWTNCTAIEPSPTAEATRFTDR